MPTSELRNLPSVDRLLSELPADGTSRKATTTAVRSTLKAARERIRAGEPAPAIAALAAEVRASLSESAQPPLRRVINASGVILQTNLGRAPLSDRALAAISGQASGYSNLELDLGSGQRGSRHDLLRPLLREVTGAEDAIVVNNNAAALFMVLQALAFQREVIVSRGQAVEIGGGFRIPDVLRQSGARLVEVGTTNRTYARDYEAAITTETAAILRVHTSNFRVVGFTAEASQQELSEVAYRHGVLSLDDLGAGMRPARACCGPAKATRSDLRQRLCIKPVWMARCSALTPCLRCLTLGCWPVRASTKHWKAWPSHLTAKRHGSRWKRRCGKTEKSQLLAATAGHVALHKLTSPAAKPCGKLPTCQTLSPKRPPRPVPMPTTAWSRS